MPNSSTPPSTLVDGPRRRVLIVDDSRMQRRILSGSLGRWGYLVTEAGSGADALALLADEEFDVVISDWMMPGMTGLELCRALRGLANQNYAYFILLTSKSEKNEIAQGLDGGADDFLTKPVSAGELRARLAAGERILHMQRQLQEKNRLVSSTLDKIRGMYDSLNRDLKEARKLQQSLMPERARDFDAASIVMDMQSSGHVGGDLVGFFPIGSRQLGLFSIDVSGHGVASALMTARLAGFFSGTMPERNIALIAEGCGYRSNDPAKVASMLNRMICDETEDDRYLTLFYGVLDLATGILDFVQAGHPHPALVRADGRVERLGGGGLPVGILETAEYETVSARLMPGDRLVVVSDGVSECEDRQGIQFDDGGFEHLLSLSRDLGGAACLARLMQTLGFHREGQQLADDVSVLLVDYAGDRQAAKKASPGLPR